MCERQWVWLQASRDKLSFSWRRTGSDSRYRHYVSPSNWASHDVPMSIALRQWDINVDPWTIIGLVCLKPIGSFDHLIPLNDMQRCQYRFWVHSCLCEPVDLRLFDVFDFKALQILKLVTGLCTDTVHYFHVLRLGWHRRSLLTVLSICHSCQTSY